VWHINEGIKMFLIVTAMLKNLFPTLKVRGLNSGTAKKK
jgi:hypothetical protein